MSAVYKTLSMRVLCTLGTDVIRTIGCTNLRDDTLENACVMPV